ncbi:hypothetical protein JTB14_031528 [Gonioctena quinquepunctata]|nr:hypothetical protein JTB14_031528 [Gonioctena quinquepunctata]
MTQLSPLSNGISQCNSQIADLNAKMMSHTVAIEKCVEDIGTRCTKSHEFEENLITLETQFVEASDHSFENIYAGTQDRISHVMVKVGGDYNSCISNLGTVPPEILVNTNLYEDRLSNHEVVNTRGRTLPEFMWNNSFTILNGRNPSDKPANLIHGSFYEKNHQKDIDLMGRSSFLLHYNVLNIFGYPLTYLHLRLPI